MQNKQLPDFVNFLLQPAAYTPPPAGVKLVQTHISYVFITADLVYKFKKPVDFGFLDFTTLDKRKYYCQRELVLNRRLCPSIYLGLVALKKTGSRFILVDPAREDQAGVIEYGVKMKRMPEEQMMTNVMQSGRLVPAMIDAICDVLVPFYQKAAGDARIQEFGRPEAVAVNILENFSQTEPFIDSAALSRQQYEAIKGYAAAFLQRDKLFGARIDAGRIRDCHGDLYSANICLADKVYIFDCIEFNDRFRYCDVASDIGFLAMDLDYHGLSSLADHFVARFVEKSGDDGLATMLNFYKCYRAYVRGKINLFTANDPGVDETARHRCQDMAAEYFRLAERYASL